MLNQYIIYGLFVVGVIAILSSFVDSKWIISKLFSKKTKVVQSTASGQEEVFLHIISLWYQLKEQCDACNLTVASDKLDEVFPLLNKVLDDQKTA